MGTLETALVNLGNAPEGSTVTIPDIKPLEDRVSNMETLLKEKFAVYPESATGMVLDFQYITQKLGWVLDEDYCGPDHTGYVTQRGNSPEQDKCAWGFKEGTGQQLAQYVLARTSVWITEGGYVLYNNDEFVLVKLPHLYNIDDLDLSEVYPTEFKSLNDIEDLKPLKDGVDRMAFDVYGITEEQYNSLAVFRVIPEN